MLTVVAQVPNKTKSHGRRWLCNCDCGGSIETVTSSLNSGKTYHCGCQRYPDLTGKVFGKLTIIGRTDKRGPRGARTVPLWECRCECGNISYKATDTLTNPDESMCKECSDKLHTSKARANAGFVGGTQISKMSTEKLSRANTSGHKGVYYEKSSGKWRAHIGFRGQRIKLGTFAKLEDAVKARQRGEEEYFGKFLEDIKG